MKQLAIHKQVVENMQSLLTAKNQELHASEEQKQVLQECLTRAENKLVQNLYRMCTTKQAVAPVGINDDESAQALFVLRPVAIRPTGMSTDFGEKLIQQNARLKKTLRQVFAVKDMPLDRYLDQQELQDVNTQLRASLDESKRYHKKLKNHIADVQAKSVEYSTENERLRAENASLREELAKHNTPSL